MRTFNSKKDKLLHMSHNIRLKIRDSYDNIAIIEEINTYRSRLNRNRFYKLLADTVWAQNWTLLIINICTIFEKNEDVEADELTCSLFKVWEIINNYKKLTEKQKKIKRKIVECRAGFMDFKIEVVDRNREIRSKCLVHNDLFKKRKYDAHQVEVQKQLLEYSEHYLALLGQFLNISIHPISKNVRLKRSIWEVIKEIPD